MKTISLKKIKIPKITAPNKIAMSKADSISDLTVVFRILIGKTEEILNLNSIKLCPCIQVILTNCRYIKIKGVYPWGFEAKGEPQATAPAH